MTPQQSSQFIHLPAEAATGAKEKYLQLATLALVDIGPEETACYTIDGKPFVLRGAQAASLLCYLAANSGDW